MAMQDMAMQDMAMQDMAMQQSNLPCLDSVIARLQSTPTMMLDAPTLNPRASNGGPCPARTPSRVARSVTSPHVAGRALFSGSHSHLTKQGLVATTRVLVKAWGRSG
jgi:hypothetical protein